MMASNTAESPSIGRRRPRVSHSRRNSTDDNVIVLGSSDCIDLTTENNDDVIDITRQNMGLMDLPVVVLTPTDYIGPIRHQRGSGRRGRRRESLRNRRNNRGVEVTPTAAPAYVYLTDDSDNELPEISDQPPPGLAPNSSVLQSPENLNIICPICMDDTRQIRRTQKVLKSTTCGHIFCNVCIEAAIRMQHMCPTCRKRLTMRNIHPLFI